MHKVAKFLNRCNDCTPVFFIAGDLVHDNSGDESTYGLVHLSLEAKGIKIFDGLGNHDTKNFRDDWVSFDSRVGLYHVIPGNPANRSDELDSTDRRLAGFWSSRARGWSIYHEGFDYIDRNEWDKCDPSNVQDGRFCGDPCKAFRFDDSYYCVNKSAWYYAVALNSPTGMHEITNGIGAGAGPMEAGALVVQLHNFGRSKSAVNFLESLHDKLQREGKTGIPIVLVAHQLAGSERNRFDSLAAELNIAAFLHGHDRCNGREYAHCDSQDPPSTYLGYVRNDGNLVTNANGTPIPTVNTNAIFHNIFWATSLDTDAGKITFKRLNAGEISAATQTEPVKSASDELTYLRAWEDYANALDPIDFHRLLSDYHTMFPGSHNFPEGATQHYVCDYESGKRVPCSVGPWRGREPDGPAIQ